jgi:hypothetical protein
MKRTIAAGMAALMCASALPAPLASAKTRDQPPPPYAYWRDHGAPPPGHEVQGPPPGGWNDRRQPPPGWGQNEWRNRSEWLRRHGYHDDHDSAKGLVIGTILGFVLGAAIADSRDRQDYANARLNDPSWIAYCARKYRSFDPYSGTYMGTDGLRHYCR